MDERITKICFGGMGDTLKRNVELTEEVEILTRKLKISQFETKIFKDRLTEIETENCDLRVKVHDLERKVSSDEKQIFRDGLLLNSLQDSHREQKKINAIREKCKNEAVEKNREYEKRIENMQIEKRCLKRDVHDLEKRFYPQERTPFFLPHFFPFPFYGSPYRALRPPQYPPIVGIPPTPHGGSWNFPPRNPHPPRHPFPGYYKILPRLPQVEGRKFDQFSSQLEPDDALRNSESEDDEEIHPQVSGKATLV